MSVLHQLLPVIYQRPCKIDCADLPNPGKKTFLWNQEKEDAFQELKEALALSHVLVIPNKDDMFVLDTGDSHRAIDVEHIQTDQERVVTYASFALAHQQQR